MTRRKRKIHCYMWPFIPVAWVCAPFVFLYIWIICNAEKSPDDCRHRHLESDQRYTHCLDCGGLVDSVLLRKQEGR